MPQPKRRNSQQLDKVIELVQARYSASALRRGRDLPAQRLPAAIGTSFPQLDAITGCNGVPLNHITLLSGRDLTSGKLTLGYKILSTAQVSGPSRSSRKHLVAVMSLNRTINPDYLIRCGVDVNYAAVLQPQTGGDAINLIADVARSRRARALLVDSLPDLIADAKRARRFEAALNVIEALTVRSNCALIFLDDPKPLWLRLLPIVDRSPVRQVTALHLELTNDAWVEYEDGHDRLRGYRSRVEVVHSRWARSGQSTRIEVLFNGTVKAAPTWR